ncbi:chemotaxis protein methyltransferase [Geomonas silvestris]|uniref:protein-glutamate O-methyltransferase n=1 Tax=Geomonas silvestris TaxID=2740184 RepID=A0A6V8MD32_9BACT|nr:protein-glutamate O-methyltransferase CheR [Geomonas silvestris]GFO57905.1 chemotaxis protein methyltransferase [Geomonas silvestris]
MAISDKDFEQLRDFIYRHCGIYFNAAKKYFLESRVSHRLAATGIKTAAEYHALLSSPAGATELKFFMDEITTNETYFFRNPAQLKALEQKLFADIVEKKNKIGFRKLRIWSAASSSGEEAYTLAMVILEHRSTLFKDWIIEIVGTDINETVIAQAKEGVYNAYSVRNVPPHLKSKYFKEDGGKYILSAEVKKFVTFNKLNLFDDTKMIFMKSFDLIFCANVLIYFDLAAKAKVVQHFYNNLQPYGYFFIGQSESLHGVNDLFKLVHFPGGFAYCK